MGVVVIVREHIASELKHFLQMLQFFHLFEHVGVV